MDPVTLRMVLFLEILLMIVLVAMAQHDASRKH
jgi:hypothetical protein